MLAKQVGVGHTTVQRVWKEHGLKPHLTRSFKLSNDPQFAEKVQDIVGLYLNPPDNALVLSVDEKSQIQALDRTQPGLPIKKGRAGTMTHDYKRNGVTTLFAALVAAKAKGVTQMQAGEVIGECMPRHRAKEFLRFLKKIDATVAGISMCTSFATTTEPTRPRRCRHGWQSIRVSRCITRLPLRPGLISWRGCSPKSPASKSGAAFSKALRILKSPSTPGSPNGTLTRHPSNGPPKPTKSWKKMLAHDRSSLLRPRY